jgi:hypothetical protein
VQQCPQLLRRGGREGGPRGLGAAGAGTELREAPRIEGVERLADRLVVAADLASNGPGVLPPSTREQDLTAGGDNGR